MNFRKRMMSAMLLVMLLCSMCVSSVLAEDANGAKVKGRKEVQILFTHDMHSHMDAYQIKKKNGQMAETGGFARLKTAIDEKRKENPCTFLFDGGDFSMGTLYQTIYETHASELTMLGRMGYDAVTLGNHEFDYRSEGLCSMLHAAKEKEREDSTWKLPALVSANIDWDENVSEENKLVKKALEEYGSTPSVMIERNGVHIGVFGVLGEDADACAPASGLEFEDIKEIAKKMTEKLKKEGASLIVCLSHSGTNEDADRSEDELLAKEVPEIDVVVSGHTHTKLKEAVCVGETYIVSAGSNCSYLGELDLVQKENGRWEMQGYHLNRLDDKVREDAQITEELDGYKEAVNETYLNQFGYTFDQVLADNQVAFTQRDAFAKRLEEDPLGSLIADAYVYTAEKVSGEKVDAAFAPSGAVRDTFQKGSLTVADVFNVSSLGIGADRIPGYPLVSVYLTGEELKTAAEIDVSVSPLMTTAQLYPSGIHWTYNPNRMILNRVTEVRMADDVPYTGEADEKEIEDDRLYHVVAGLYSAQMLGAVEDTSKGLLKIVPKDREGKEIDNFEDFIIHDENGAELKEWYALAMYLESFEKNEEGKAQIPAYYAKPHGRKEKTDSRNVAELLKNPNRFALIFYGIIVLLILFMALVIRIVIKRRKKKKNMLY